MSAYVAWFGWDEDAWDGWEMEGAVVAVQVSRPSPEGGGGQGAWRAWQAHEVARKKHEEQDEAEFLDIARRFFGRIK